MKHTGLIILIVVSGLLLTAGCTLTSGPSGSSTGSGSPAQGTPVATTPITGIQATTTSPGALVLDDSFNILSGYQTRYKKYAFEDLNYQYLYPGDRFTISVVSDKPVNVLVIGKTDELKFDTVEPQWDTVLKPDQWDYSPLVPAFCGSNVQKKDMTFTIEDKSIYFLIVDPRFASDPAGWNGSRHDEVHVKVRLTKL